jgi:hypothetical protein
MDKLINKRADTYDYLSRYTGISYFYDTKAMRDVAGICKAMKLDTPYISHKLIASDTLDSLALKYYNNPTYWWAIAYFNKIIDPFKPLVSRYTVIKIPNLSGITFKD